MSYSSLYNDANAARLDMENITSEPGVPRPESQQILRRVRDNDPTLTYVGVDDRNDTHPMDDHCVYSAWLGYFIGKNNHLQELYVDVDIRLGYFFEGLSHNSSIRKLTLDKILERGRLGYVFQELVPFLKKNHNLAEIEVNVDQGGSSGVSFDAQDYQLMAIAIGECSGSLTKFSFENESYYEGGVGGTNCIPLALSMHPKLREIHLNGVDIGRNACIALGTLFKNTTTELEVVSMSGIGLDDEGVLALVDSLNLCNKLSSFELMEQVGIITNIGWKSLSTLLESPSSNLEHLLLDFTTITDEQAQMMATALKCNKKLKTLILEHEEGIITESWSVFTKVACDTTNINSTFQSNHTLNAIRLGWRADFKPKELKSLLALNADPNKKKVAMTKILKHHRHFNMEPFFEWDLKLLPLMLSWLKRAGDLTTDFETHIDERKSSSIYQFVRAMPMLAIGRAGQV